MGVLLESLAVAVPKDVAIIRLLTTAEDFGTHEGNLESLSTTFEAIVISTQVTTPGMFCEAGEEYFVARPNPRNAGQRLVLYPRWGLQLGRLVPNLLKLSYLSGVAVSWTCKNPPMMWGKIMLSCRDSPAGKIGARRTK